MGATDEMGTTEAKGAEGMGGAAEKKPADEEMGAAMRGLPPGELPGIGEVPGMGLKPPSRPCRCSSNHCRRAACDTQVWKFVNMCDRGSQDEAEASQPALQVLLKPLQAGGL